MIKLIKELEDLFEKGNKENYLAMGNIRIHCRRLDWFDYCRAPRVVCGSSNWQHDCLEQQRQERWRTSIMALALKKKVKY
tara:strand:- start:5 stop:244 length:240 start_codon:yes stop_codon:yes gene_type:complete